MSSRKQLVKDSSLGNLQNNPTGHLIGIAGKKPPVPKMSRSKAPANQKMNPGDAYNPLISGDSSLMPTPTTDL